MSTYSFQTVFGEVRGDPSAYGAIEAQLAAGPLTLGELAGALGRSVGDLLNVVPLLIEAGRLGFDRGIAAEASLPVVKRATNTLLELAARGHPYAFLPAPAVGSAVAFGPVEVLLQRGRTAGLKAHGLIDRVLRDLDALGQQLSDPQGQPITDESRRRELVKRADAVLSERLPALEALQVF